MTCKNFNWSDVACAKGNDCDCVEGQDDNIRDLSDWPQFRNEMDPAKGVFGFGFIAAAVFWGCLIGWLL